MFERVVVLRYLIRIVLQVFVTMADTAAVLKDQGNAAFKNNHLSAAIDLYSKALRKTDDNELKTTLLSNRAICYHKNKDYSKCIDDCKNALTLRPTHTKALFRLAAAYEANRDYADAHNALKRLFAVDSNNADGLKLMRTVKSKLIELQQENSSQVKRVLETACQDSTKLETGLKTLVGLCYDDKYNAFDLGSKGGWQFLHKVIEENMIDAVDDKKKADLVVAAVRVISASSNHKQFVERYVDVHGEVNGKIDLLWLSNLLSSRIPDVLGPAMVLVMTVLRMLPLSVPQQPSVNSGETENKESSNKTPLEPYLREHSARHILRNVKNALLCGDPENYSILSESLSAFLSDSVDYFAQEKEVDRRLETLEERKERFAIENVVARRAQQHCAWAINEGIFSVLVDHTDSENFRIRQSASACIGRLIHFYNNDEGMKAFLKPYLVGDENDTDNTLLDNNREEKQVVEILDTVPPPIADCRKRAALEAALLVSRPDLGAWTLTQTGAIKQLLLLVSTGDLRCQEIATEVMCLAASTESAASLLAPVVSSGALGNLMKSPSTAIRAAAASTMTKLSIKAKALTEDAAEVSHVLNTVLTVLKAASNISNTKEQNKDQNLVSFSSLDDVSRVSQTKNKEEIRKVSKQLAKEFESNSVTMTSVERAVEVCK